jgi:hypothetical protein
MTTISLVMIALPFVTVAIGGLLAVMLHSRQH